MIPTPSKKIIVIIPTYNEAGNINALIEDITRHAGDIPLLFVDDNSTDGTQALIEGFIAKQPERFFMIKRPGKLGLGTAYVTGFKWACARGYDAVVEMDADLSHRAVDLQTIVKLLEHHPAVVGSRYIRGGSTVNWSPSRKFISRVGSWYARTILQLDVRDLTGGFNGWQREVLEAINLDAVKSEGYAFQIELKYRTHLAGFPVLETPITFVERRVGQSKMSKGIVFEAIYRVWQLLGIRREISPKQSV